MYSWFQNKNAPIPLFFVVGDSNKLGIINKFYRTSKEKNSNIFYHLEQQDGLMK